MAIQVPMSGSPGLDIPHSRYAGHVDPGDTVTNHGEPTIQAAVIPRSRLA